MFVLSARGFPVRHMEDHMLNLPEQPQSDRCEYVYINLEYVYTAPLFHTQRPFHKLPTNPSVGSAARTMEPRDICPDSTLFQMAGEHDRMAVVNDNAEPYSLVK